jgi:hypothetical protein
MRNLLLFGTVGAAIVVGAGGAYAIPSNSPYAIWEPQAVEAQMSEGRAAYDQGSAAGAPQRPSWEESTYYSRGK